MVSFDGLADGREHVAILFGEPSSVPLPLVRVHSECLTGDIFGSARCDCGPQLREALSTIEAESGVLVYLRQEGRGIGLYNKLDAYTLQDDGYDTYEANRALNFAGDLRDYTSAAQILLALDIRRIRLLTNNPEKSEQLRRLGVDVSLQIPTGVYANHVNFHYLKTKVNQAGHMIKLDGKRADYD
ncbi:GTP cyclohydrolase II [Streptomyces sp. NPDC001985]|uniref:GTP cyclohydrolase II n=1 Tax=Streptomyces sp. NPDC001985 TaxID=3154406 RepID=UPI00332F2551